MENLLIIKNFFKKLSFNPLFYCFSFLFFITGYFNNYSSFILLILIHEFGHFFVAYLFKYKIIKVTIYPFGGCTELEYNINSSFFSEFLIIISGPLLQLLFTFIIYKYYPFVPLYFYNYSMLILLFNIIPIFPLDGGRLFNLLFSCYFSFYYCMSFTYFFSYFLSFYFFFICFFICKYLFFSIVFFSLII
jgi:stage IV sporulation protein FB